jgi:hypothetical protein
MMRYRIADTVALTEYPTAAFSPAFAVPKANVAQGCPQLSVTVAVGGTEYASSDSSEPVYRWFATRRNASPVSVAPGARTPVRGWLPRWSGTSALPAGVPAGRAGQQRPRAPSSGRGVRDPPSGPTGPAGLLHECGTSGWTSQSSPRPNFSRSAAASA